MGPIDFNPLMASEFFHLLPLYLRLGALAQYMPENHFCDLNSYRVQPLNQLSANKNKLLVIARAHQFQEISSLKPLGPKDLLIIHGVQHSNIAQWIPHLEALTCTVHIRLQRSLCIEKLESETLKKLHPFWFFPISPRFGESIYTLDEIFHFIPEPYRQVDETIPALFPFSDRWLKFSPFDLELTLNELPSNPNDLLQDLLKLQNKSSRKPMYDLESIQSLLKESTCLFFAKNSLYQNWSSDFSMAYELRVALPPLDSTHTGQPTSRTSRLFAFSCWLRWRLFSSWWKKPWSALEYQFLTHVLGYSPTQYRAHKMNQISNS